MKFSLVQILVVVATTQMKSLWTEVEKGFIRTLIDYELIVPKRISESLKMDGFTAVHLEREIG